MDQISILSIVLVSFPEAIVVCLLGIVSIGKFSYIEDKNNYLRILIFAVSTSILSFFIRRQASNVIEIFIINVLITCILFIFIMRFKFYESILATLFSLVIFIVTEAICITSLTSILGIKIDDVYASDFIRILLTIPERILQIALVYLSIRFSIRIVDLESKNIGKKEYLLQLIVYIVSIGTMLFLALLMLRMLLFEPHGLVSPTSSLLLRLNIYLTVFVTLILTLAIRTISEFYKNRKLLSNNELLQSLDYLSNLVDNKKFDDAKDAIDSLRTYIEKH